MKDIRDIFREAHARTASDVHISVNAAPVFRIHGELVAEGDKLSPQDTETMARTLLNEIQWDMFQTRGDFDFSYSLTNVSRFRVNVYRQRSCISIAARIIPTVVPTLDELRMPSVIKSLTMKHHGLILVTGPTGSGKSTTLAAMIDHINKTQRKHVITLEDPIEYLHRHNLSMIDQREMGSDSRDFSSGLRAALRQDPDVILVGEMRDLETIRTAITASETGHLVLATLHTSDAVQTMDRIIDSFAAGQQMQVRAQLSAVLIGVISQRLFPMREGKGRTAALEILMNTPAIANLIRTEKTHQIRSSMQMGRAYGMQTMEMHVRELIRDGQIHEDALAIVNVV
ncbi:type IV pilus twitching motility protein PilT [Ferroacidibacillus organovorans]|uniref:Type IV pili twitching motility protein PilT n=1 Tax=Ferroacidibacillus organovorans TaxID=1765683 RepID=A0A101XSI2_9BACL|nr:type IV pilus twitching motility protein PilT [Ferroacidibacillus organovorans]KUO96730.1 type IV pili twitching motility protein PilT [Ferroacidibacillus organovorans]